MSTTSREIIAINTQITCFAVVETYGIEAVSSGEKAKLQKDLDNHPRPVLPKDVLKKRYPAAIVGSTVLAAGGVTAAAVGGGPVTLAALVIAPQALCVTAVVSVAAPTVVIGGYVAKKAWKCWKGARGSCR